MNFFTRYKRVFLIIGFLILIGLLGFLLYSLFISTTFPGTEITPGPSATTTTGTGQLPSAGTGGAGGQKPGTPTGPATIPTAEEKPVPNQKALGGLTQTPAVNNNVTAINPTLGGNGSSVQYYNPTDGKFYKLDANGNAVLLSDKVFHNVSNVVWAPQKSKAIIEYPDGAKILYNFDTGKQATLPSNWNEFDFSADSSKIVMESTAVDPENNWLAVANDDGTNAQPIEQVGENGNTVYPSWSPNGQTVAMYTKGVDLNRQEVFFVGLNGENFKSTIVEGRGFEPKWSTAGDKLAYSVYSTDSDLKPKLWVVDAQGNNIGSGRKDLGLETWASKCTFADNKTMYCGVPEGLDTGAGLVPDLAQNTRDNLYKVNIETGEKSLVAIPDGDFNMSNLVVTSDGGNLYFTDSNTKVLHKIELK
jgi:hypothetical protein